MGGGGGGVKSAVEEGFSRLSGKGCIRKVGEDCDGGGGGGTNKEHPRATGARKNSNAKEVVVKGLTIASRVLYGGGGGQCAAM